MSNFCGRTRRQMLWETGAGFGRLAGGCASPSPGFLDRAQRYLSSNERLSRAVIPAGRSARVGPSGSVVMNRSASKR